MPTDKTLVSFRSISKEKKNTLRVFLFSPCSSISFHFYLLSQWIVYLIVKFMRLTQLAEDNNDL